MQVQFDGLRRPARVAKLLRSELAAAGVPVGLAKAQDIAARAFGYATYKELQSLAGRGTASAWDEDCPGHVVEARRGRQAAALVETGLSPDTARQVVERVRPSGRNLGQAGGGKPEPAPGRQKAEAAPAGFRPAGEHDLMLLSGFGKVLTAPGEAFALQPVQARYVAALADGTVIVARSHVLTGPVTSALAFLDEGGFERRESLLVDMEDVRRLYEAHARRSASALDSTRFARFASVVETAAEKGASEIHVVAGPEGGRVTLKAPGREWRLAEVDAETGQAICRSAFEMADRADVSYRPHDYQDGLVSGQKARLPEGVLNVRLQFNPLPGGRHLSARIVYGSGRVADGTLAELGYAAGQVASIRRMRRKPMGLGIVAGPASSGKSVSLKRIIEDGLPRDTRSIATVEDPPKYEISGAVQYPVVSGRTSAERREGLREAISNALRANPDVLVIGQAGDFHAADLAFRAAAMGKQVWTTVQASDAMMAFEQLRNVGVELHRIADHTLVNGVVAQRLVRRLCPCCSVGTVEAVEMRLCEAERDAAVRDAVGGSPRLARPGGCERCDDGHDGHVLVAEVIVPDETFMDLLGEGKRGLARRHWLEHLGGVTMLERVAGLVGAGVVDPDEAERCVGLLDELEPGRMRALGEEARQAA